MTEAQLIAALARILNAMDDLPIGSHSTPMGRIWEAQRAISEAAALLRDGGVDLTAYQPKRAGVTWDARYDPWPPQPAPT